MDFLELAKNRYSCRSFSNQEVSQELMDKIIAAGISAPTGLNKQPYKLFVLDSPEAKAVLRQATPFTYGADRFIVVGCDRSAAWVRGFDQKNFADVDGSIVATHLMMEIADLGLATTWVGHFDAPMLQERFPQMKNYDLIAVFPIGYPAEDGTPSDKHFMRNSRDEMVELL